MTLSMVDLGKRLLEAAKHGLTEEVRTLMSNGAPFTTDWLGTSPLHFSSHFGHLGTSEVLLRAGISRDARTKVDRTPLHVAAQEGHLEIVELLVRNGADIDAKDMLKMTPLHWAVEKGHSVVIEFLLEHGAEVSCQNKFEKSPIDIAITNGRADLAQLLQQNVVEVSTSAEEHPYVGEVTEVSAAEAETIAATESVGGGDIVTTSSGSGYINTQHITSGKKGESTEVLATLAALAEVTAGSSAAEGTATTPTTTDNDTLKWLESQGITMISADNSTIVGNTVENGQQLTLTEAGRLALNHIVKQKIGDNAETNGNIVTIVSSDGMENAMGDSIVMSCESTEINTDEHDGEPTLKRIKMEVQPHTDDEGLDPQEGVVLDDDINIKLEGAVVEEQYGVEEEYPPTETTVVEGLGVDGVDET